MAILKLFVTLASLAALTLGAGANATTDSDWLVKQSKALNIINDFADNMCTTIPLEGKGGTFEIIPGSWPTYPLPRRDDASFFTRVAPCITTSKLSDSVWKIECDYIGAGGVIGFAVDSDEKDGFPSGTLVISSPEATQSHRF